MENETQQIIPPVQPLPQTPTPVPTPSSTNWSKIILFTVLGSVVIAGSILVGIQIGKNQTVNQQIITTQPTTTPTQTTTYPTPSLTEPNPTTNPVVIWKTYKDSKNNVSFQYPSNANISTTGENVIVEIEFEDQSCAVGGAYGCGWSVDIYGPFPNPEHKSLVDWVKLSFSNSPDKYTTTDTKIAGLSAVDVKILTLGASRASPGKMYYVQRVNDILIINAGVSGKTSDYQKIVDKLLSTLSLE